MDAETVSSPEGKLTHSYTACLSIARAALVLCGYRVRSGAKSHHYLAVESLEATVGLENEAVGEIQRYRQTRHQSIYDYADSVPEGMADCALKTAEDTLKRFLEWRKSIKQAVRSRFE